jgi:hypothetical protein
MVAKDRQRFMQEAVLRLVMKINLAAVHAGDCIAMKLSLATVHAGDCIAMKLC